LGQSRTCTRTLTLGTFTHRDRAGTNTLTFSGKLKRHVLKAGIYKLQAVATVAHRSSRQVGTIFTVVG